MFATRLTEVDTSLARDSKEIEFAGGKWLSPTELATAAANGELECGGEQEITWLRMWQQEEDEEGETVAHAYGAR